MNITTIRKLPAEAVGVGAEYDGHMIVGARRGRWRADLVWPRSAAGMQVEAVNNHHDGLMLLYGGATLLRLHGAEGAADVEAIGLQPGSWTRALNDGLRWHVGGAGLTGGTLRELHRFWP